MFWMSGSLVLSPVEAWQHPKLSTLIQFIELSLKQDLGSLATLALYQKTFWSVWQIG